MATKAKKVLGESQAGNVKSKAKGKSVEDTYQKKTQLEHILLRPDTYIGSTEKLTQSMMVFEDGTFVTRDITFVPGLFKIFDEILVNAADHKQRSDTMDRLEVTIDAANNTISVKNNGAGIPIEYHSKEKCYVPELIFGHLLTGSNFDDKEKKVTGGRNGYGAKLCNIFSTEFMLETADKNSGQYYKQVFKNNMSVKGEPKIEDCDEDWTKITFKPDLAKFNMEELDADTVALLTRRVYDIAGAIKGVKVYFNGDKLKVKSFKGYAELVVKNNSGDYPLVHEKVNDRWEVLFTVSETGFQQSSFVNSIATTKGGTHVTLVTDQIVARITKAAKKQTKDFNLKPFQVKNHLHVFINALIENPTFDSQTKDNLTLRAKSFGSKCVLSEKFFKDMEKSGVVSNVVNYANFKSQAMLAKSSKSAKKSRLTGIPKLDDANEAGTRNSECCTLILTEGDSAKALAVSGLSIVGRDRYGVFPLKGKLLNVREASLSQVKKNAEIQNIVTIMGLHFGTKYTDTKTLRYGHLMIMTDQDQDGSHIKGLLINFIHHFWPSLLQIPGFLIEFVTPIVKATKGKKQQSFFTLPEYETWAEANDGAKGYRIKYYKGLGTSTPQEAKEYFSEMDSHVIEFRYDSDEDGSLIDMAFSKKKVEERKQWLRRFSAGTFLDHNADSISYADFINKELILFSRSDNERSIPSMVDGLKPGQRKVLFSCLKRKLKEEIKVAQLAGYVSEHSSYHHGEVSLTSTIVNMAQAFVGSNNCNLLLPIGQFGTRIQGGKDCASPRYIFTTLSPITRAIFNEQDDALLDYLVDDGLSIEPQYYMPILPMVLVNGADGIGTGWSSKVPNYNPEDIVKNIRLMLKGEEPQAMTPWYKGFTGTVEPNPKDSRRFDVRGVIAKTSESTLDITELPVGKWTQPYKEWLDSQTGDEDDKVKSYKEYHSDRTVHFVVTMTPGQMASAEAAGLHKRFKLDGSICTTNMMLFNNNGQITKYDTAVDIVKEFYALRLEKYQQRKVHMTAVLEEVWQRLDNKVRFILAVIAGDIVINNRKKTEILGILREMNFKPFPKKSASKKAGEESDETDNDESTSDFDYLLSMPLWSLTLEKVEKLKRESEDKMEELSALLGKEPKDLWEADLDDFEEGMEKVKEMDAADEIEAIKWAKKGGGSKGGKKAAAKKSKKKTMVDSDDDDFDSEDDWAPPPKKTSRKASTATTTTAAAAAARKRASPDVPSSPAGKTKTSRTTKAKAKPASAASSKKKKTASGSSTSSPAVDEEEASESVRALKKRASPPPEDDDFDPNDAFAFEDKENEPTPAVKKPRVVKKPARKAAARKVVVESDFESEDDFVVSDDDFQSAVEGDDDEESDFAPTPVKTKKTTTKKPAAKKASKPKTTTKATKPKKKKIDSEAELEDEDDFFASPSPKPKTMKKKAAAAKPAAAKKKAAAPAKKTSKKSSRMVESDDEDNFDESDADEDIITAATPVAVRKPGRRAAAKAQYKFEGLSEEELEEDDEDSEVDFLEEESDDDFEL